MTHPLCTRQSLGTKQERFALIRRLDLMMVILIATALLNGCTSITDDKPEKKQKLQTEWPRPPQPVRYRYVTTLRTPKDIERHTRETAMRDLLTGGAKEGKTPFKEPYGIAAHKGIIYITDTRLRSVHVFDIPRGRYFRMGYRREGRLDKPLGVAIGNDLVYVVDTLKKLVFSYDRLGLYQRTIGADAGLIHPTGIAASPDGGRIYVVDTGGVDEPVRHRVMVFDPEGKKLLEFGRRGNKPGEFNLPVDVTVGPDGSVHVLDAGNFRVQTFDPDGKFIRTWGSVGNNWGQFARPKAITSDSDGNIYVLDAAFGNVQVFDSKGRLLLDIGKRDISHNAPGKYALPTGVFVDVDDYLYIVDRVFKKVDVITRVKPKP